MSKSFITVLLAGSIAAMFHLEAAQAQDVISSSENVLEGAEKLGRKDALLRCQQAITSVAEVNKPSNVMNFVVGRLQQNVWHFSWPQGAFSFEGKAGVHIPQSAQCKVDAWSGQVLSLVISGQTIPADRWQSPAK